VAGLINHPRKAKSKLRATYKRAAEGRGIYCVGLSSAASRLRETRVYAFSPDDRTRLSLSLSLSLSIFLKKRGEKMKRNRGGKSDCIFRD